MSVKDKVTEYVTTADDAFRASDVALAIDENIVNVRTALSTLKGEGIVESVDRGLYKATGVEVEIKEKPKSSAQKKSRDALESVTDTLKRSLERIAYEISKIDEEMEVLGGKIEELKDRSRALHNEAEKIKRAYDALEG